MERHVEITFDCLPLRSLGRIDIPLDASPKFRAKCERVQKALATHGTLNTYYLHNAACVFRFTNKPDFGMVEFSFEGTVMTDEADCKTTSAQLDVELQRETCDWLTEPVVQWLRETVRYAVMVEFDRYIEAGDLSRTMERLARNQAEMESSGGYVGMGL